MGGVLGSFGLARRQNVAHAAGVLHRPPGRWRAASWSGTFVARVVSKIRMLPKLLALLALLPLAAAGSDRDALLAAQHQWLEGYNHRDAKAVAAVEADDFRITMPDGNIQTKADQLAALNRSVPAGATYEIATESTEARVYGTAAVLTGVVVEKGSFPGEKPFSQRSRYTDTWIRKDGKWRVVASHLGN